MGKLLLWGLAGVAGLIVLAVGLNMAGTFTSVATAPGRVIQQTLETDNIINNYEWFFDYNANYEARMGQIREFESLLKDPDVTGSERNRLRIELAAQRQSCRSLATKYNANSEKMNTAIFKGWSLPETLQMESCG